MLCDGVFSSVWDTDCDIFCVSAVVLAYRGFSHLWFAVTPTWRQMEVL